MMLLMTVHVGHAPALTGIQQPASVLYSSSSSSWDVVAATSQIGSIFAPAWDTARTIQRVGESAFTAIFMIAFLQAFLAVFQYRTNPAGELIVPPGPTIGVETPGGKRGGVNAWSTRSRNRKRLLRKQNIIQIKTSTRREKKSRKNNKSTGTVSLSSSTSAYTQILNRINRFLFILIPLATKTASTFLASQWHLMHIGFIISLVQFFGAPASLAEKLHYVRRNEGMNANPHGPQRMDELSSRLGTSTKTAMDTIKNKVKVENVIVIGDSLAVGLGSVNVFDTNKNHTLDYYLAENLDASSDLPGPVFPRRLASKFADCQKHSVQWRSAGVDGGTVPLIQKFCLGVIRDECISGRRPDCVVILCGINDLKQWVSNPFRSVSPREFRQQLNQLVTEIRVLCPGVKVVLPALPIQMFHFNSPLDVFPLGIFLDTIVGFWEYQKKAAVEDFPSDDVMYVPLSREEIDQWYQAIDDADTAFVEIGEGKRKAIIDDGSLIALDGVHPSSKCYAKWAESVALYVCTQNKMRRSR